MPSLKNPDALEALFTTTITPNELAHAGNPFANAQKVDLGVAPAETLDFDHS